MSDPKQPDEEPVDMPTEEDYLAALGPCGK